MYVDVYFYRKYTPVGKDGTKQEFCYITFIIDVVFNDHIKGIFQYYPPNIVYKVTCYALWESIVPVIICFILFICVFFKSIKFFQRF